MRGNCEKKVMENRDLIVKDLCERFPCRKFQFDLLLRLFGERHQVVPYQSIFLYGCSGTGKSTIITAILQTLAVPHAIVNCIEGYDPRILFDLILNQISETSPSPENGYENFAKCENMNDFVRHLKRAIEARQAKDETVYIVLDKAERLRDLSGNILAVFLRLRELIQMNVCVILISEIIWEKFRIVPGLIDPFQIHFPEYSKDNLCTILSKDCPEPYSLPFYLNYIQLVLSVFYLACRNLPEIKYLARQNFPKYVAPIESGDATEADVKILWKNIEPQLKKSMQNVYLRRSVVEESVSTKAPQPVSGRLPVELPLHSKFLLLAAYLASYNPTSIDERLFVKKHEKVGKRAKLSGMKRNMKVSSHLLGPKPFTLDRMLAIFYSIVEDRVKPTAQLYSQIATLVSLNMLSPVGRETLDQPKYKCVVSLEFIKLIARNVEFDIGRYLYDFM